MKKEISRRGFLLNLAYYSVAAGLKTSGIDPLSINENQAENIKNSDIGEMLPYEKRKGVVTASNMPVYIFPVNGDYFYDYWKDIKRSIPSTIEEYNVSGIELGYLNLFKSIDPRTGQTQRFSILPHTTGQKGIPISLFDSGQTTGNGKYEINKRYYSNDTEFTPASGETGNEHSILAGFYPNKLKNILEAMKAIDDYQQDNGGFVAGKEYSMLEILDLSGRNGYVLGLNSSKGKVNGGGVCVVATNMCKLQTLMGAEIVERWQHPSEQRYSSSPLAGWKLRAANSDATVETARSSQEQAFDFRWISPKSGYIKLSAAILPNGERVANDFGDQETGGRNADATILATFKWSDRNPGEQSSNLETLKTNYINYRGGSGERNISSGNRFIRETAWRENDSNTHLINKIAPEERVDTFSNELRTNPFLSQLVTLRGLINTYDSDSNSGVGKYLKSTDWYKDQISRLGEGSGREKYEAALRHLDYNTNISDGQPVQCVGLAVLLSGLSYPSYAFKDIGGATREKDGLPITCAADLVPNCIKDGSRSQVFKNGMQIMSVQTLEEINPGDLYVLYHAGAGHIGGVIGKKYSGSETVLLCAAANQTSKGDMKIFQVDGNNFDVVMGPNPFKKVIIR